MAVETPSSVSPLKIVVVGAGFAGITAAIECKNRGFSVVLVEKYNNSNDYGDIIDFFANAGRIIEAWDDGKVADELLEICITNAKCFQVKKWDGTAIYNDPWYLRPEHARRQYAGHRGEMWQIIIQYAKRIGVETKFGCAVKEYLEEEKRAGVELENGEVIWGDCVIAADGPRSSARQKVLHLADQKVNSGYAIYRAFFFVNDEHRANPLLKDFCRGEEDIIKIWVGENAHMLAYSWNKGQDIAWVMTHLDDHDIGESWSFPGSKKEAAQYIRHFNPECLALLEATPKEKLIDYKLVWRDPLETWLSKGARIVLIGDAAHCHLPTSAQGGSQAMEDAVTAAVCLERARGGVPLALRVMERIRFNRSDATHQSSISNRDQWHKQPWDLFEKHPEKIAMARPDWVLEFDSRENAEEHFEHIAQDIKDGKQGTIQELSLPAGGAYEQIIV